MKLSLLKRDIAKRAALAGVALVALASVVTGREKPTLEVIEAKTPRAEVSAVVEIDLDKLYRTETAAPQNDPFARRSFAPARAQRAAAAPAPAAPNVPPLPFRYIGKLLQDGKLEIILLRGAEHFTVAAAGPLDAEYRLDRISETSLAFTYLPLNTTQTLDIQ